MKIYIDEVELFEITQTDLDLLANDLVDVQSEIERRLEWSIKQKCDSCYDRMKAEWTPKFLEEDILPPKTREDFVAAVLARPDYKNRAQRDAEQQL
jgi:hypothetical protein